MDVAHRAVLEQRRGDEQAVVLGLLHERDDRGDAARRVREPSQARIGQAHRDLGVEVLEDVSREAQLREHDEVEPRPRASSMSAPCSRLAARSPRRGATCASATRMGGMLASVEAARRA